MPAGKVFTLPSEESLKGLEADSKRRVRAMGTFISPDSTSASAWISFRRLCLCGVIDDTEASREICDLGKD